MDERAAVGVDVLMDRAGLAVALAATDLGAGYGMRVAVLCGPGNNGGDGYVAARHLSQRGTAVEVMALAPPRTEPARHAAESARRAGVPIGELGSPGPVDLVVDALFGGGFRAGLPPEVAPWLEQDVPVVAVDVPTGVDPDTGVVDGGAFRAQRTVTFGALKPAHLLGAEWCGEVTVADIGLGPGEPVVAVVEDEDATLVSRTFDVHKWSAGSVLVVGGSSGMVGAAVMAGRAALHFGAGAVGIASSQIDTVAALSPELLGYSTDELPLDRYDVVVIGPGLGNAPALLERVLGEATKVVADADALVSVDVLAAAGAELILTPHAGEFTRLTAEGPGYDAARRLAEKVGGVVALKGWPTFVTDGGIPWAVVSGGPELATIGTGDVLAGMIAALWGRGMPSLDAAYAAAHWHGVAAADLATETVVTADRLSSYVGSWAQL